MFVVLIIALTYCGTGCIVTCCGFCCFGVTGWCLLLLGLFAGLFLFVVCVLGACVVAGDCLFDYCSCCWLVCWVLCLVNLGLVGLIVFAVCVLGLFCWFCCDVVLVCLLDVALIVYCWLVSCCL